MGFFGGLARGAGPIILAKKKQKHEQEIAQLEAQVNFYTKELSRPDLKPNERGIVLGHLSELASVDPTTKKGKKQESNILGQISETLKGQHSEETPKSQMIEETPGKGKELFESAFNKKMVDIPKRKSAYYSPEEMGKKELAAEKPGLEFKHKQAMELAETVAENRVKGQLAVLDVKDKYNQRLVRIRAEAKASGKLNEYAATIKAEHPELSDEEAKQQAGQAIHQHWTDQHEDSKSRNNNIKSLITTRESTYKLNLAKLDETKRFHNILASNMEFKQREARIIRDYKTSDEEKKNAKAEIDKWTAQKEAIITFAKKAKQTPEQVEATTKIINELDEKLGEAQKRYQNAADSIQAKGDALAALADDIQASAKAPTKPSGRGRPMPTKPSATTKADSSGFTPGQVVRGDKIGHDPNKTYIYKGTDEANRLIFKVQKSTP